MEALFRLCYNRWMEDKPSDLSSNFSDCIKEEAQVAMWCYNMGFEFEIILEDDRSQDSQDSVQGPPLFVLFYS